jgi:HK97 family phage portal protein
MKLPNFLVNFVLKSENAQKQFNENLESQRKMWAEEAAKVVSEQLEKERKVVPQNFVSTVSKQEFTASKEYPNKNYSTLHTLYSDAPGSIQCINRIAESVIGGGYVIEKIKGGNGLKRDLKELIKFFDSPNKDETIEMLISAGLTNYLGYGDWYVEKVPTRGTKGRKNFKVAEIYNLDTTRVKVLVDPKLKKGGVLKKVGYVREVDANKNIAYGLDEAMQFRRPNSTGGIYGKAVLENNRAILELLLRALTYNTSLLRNGGRPPIQLILPEDSTEADAQMVSAFFEKNFQGAHNAGKALVTFKGAEAKPLGITPQDMAYLELLEFGLKLVAGQYGVPLYMLGFPEGSNRASSGEGRRAYYYTVVYPLRKLIAQKLTRDIIQSSFGIEGWKVDFRSEGLEESEATRRDTMTGMSRGAMTWNEGRLRMGLLPIDEPWADKCYLLGSKNDFLMPVEEALKRKPSAESADTEDIKPAVNPGEGADLNPESGDDEDTSE